MHFVTPELREQADFVATTVEKHLAQLPSEIPSPNTIPAVEPLFAAQYARVVGDALRYNLYAKLPPLRGPEVPYGYKGIATQTARSIRKLAQLANNSV